MDHGKIERGIRLILSGLGCDMQDPNFTETPDRFARAMAELFSPKEVEYATFEEEHTDFVLLKGHRMYSLCPHHLLPVEFIVSLAYIPNGKVLGLSKLARVLHDANRGPLLQERFQHDVVEKMRRILPTCYGVAIYLEGQHGCAKMRGVRTEGSFTTFKLEGRFEADPNWEKRFFQLAIPERRR